eukprot:Ihof_evm1s178 gene=Ihof_evmTU1s178
MIEDKDRALQRDRIINVIGRSFKGKVYGVMTMLPFSGLLGRTVGKIFRVSVLFTVVVFADTYGLNNVARYMLQFDWVKSSIAIEFRTLELTGYKKEIDDVPIEENSTSVSTNRLSSSMKKQPTTDKVSVHNDSTHVKEKKKRHARFAVPATQSLSYNDVTIDKDTATPIGTLSATLSSTKTAVHHQSDATETASLEKKKIPKDDRLEEEETTTPLATVSPRVSPPMGRKGGRLARIHEKREMALKQEKMANSRSSRLSRRVARSKARAEDESREGSV